MNNNLSETIVGAIIILIACLFLYKSYNAIDLRQDNSFSNYQLNAKFTRVDGLNIGSDVRLNGIKIGKVIKMELDPKSFQAIATFSIYEGVKLPQDTSAEIIGGSLLGEKYVSISPGAEEKMLATGDTISYTQSSISLESLIGKFMFNSHDKADNTQK